MDTTPIDGAILKTGVLGRVKTPPQRQEQLLDAFERSKRLPLRHARVGRKMAREERNLNPEARYWVLPADAVATEGGLLLEGDKSADNFSKANASFSAFWSALATTPFTASNPPTVRSARRAVRMSWR